MTDPMTPAALAEIAARAAETRFDNNRSSDIPRLLAEVERLAAENARLRDAERRKLLPVTCDGHAIGLGSNIWGLFEGPEGERFWAVAEVTATYENADGRAIDAQMVIDRDTRIECEHSSFYAYAFHPETDQSADEARAAIDAAKETR